MLTDLHGGGAYHAIRRSELIRPILTHLAGVINGIDYPRKGLTLERMGLAGKTPAEIRAHVGAPTAELAGAPASKA